MQGLPGTAVYIDNILVTGPDDATHLKTLKEVLSRLARVGLRVNKKKCGFMLPSVVYLGHRIDADGLHPLAEKIQAVLDAPAPKNVTELWAYLGLLGYYGKFLPSQYTLSTIALLARKGCSMELDISAGCRIPGVQDATYSCNIPGSL